MEFLHENPLITQLTEKMVKLSSGETICNAAAIWGVDLLIVTENQSKKYNKMICFMKHLDVIGRQIDKNATTVTTTSATAAAAAIHQLLSTYYFVYFNCSIPKHIHYTHTSTISKLIRRSNVILSSVNKQQQQNGNCLCQAHFHASVCHIRFQFQLKWCDTWYTRPSNASAFNVCDKDDTITAID